MGPGDRVPRWIIRQLASKHVGSSVASFAAHAVSLPDEAADLDIREPIEVGANARQLPLHFGIERGWVLLRIDEIGNPGEDEARRLPERFILQLPDSVH